MTERAFRRLTTIENKVLESLIAIAMEENLMKRSSWLILVSTVISFLAVIPARAQTTAGYVSITPCRMVDTRVDSSGGPITTTVRNLTLTGAAYSGVPASKACVAVTAVPTNATSVQVNFTMIGPAGSTDLRVAPYGVAPVSSVMNSAAGATIANAIVEAMASDGAGGMGISVKSGGAQFNLLVDVVGYYTNIGNTAAAVVAGFNNSGSGPGVHGYSGNGNGVQGYASATGTAGVYGENNNYYGVYGKSDNALGVYGNSTASVGVEGVSANADGVHGTGGGYGVSGLSTGLAGVYGTGSQLGVFGQTSSSTNSGVLGRNESSGDGVFGYSISGNGVDGRGDDSAHNGVAGFSLNGDGVYGRGDVKNGVEGYSLSATGVRGVSSVAGFGVWGSAGTNDGVHGDTNNTNFAGVGGYNGGSGPAVSGFSSLGNGVLGYSNIDPADTTSVGSGVLAWGTKTCSGGNPNVFCTGGSVGLSVAGAAFMDNMLSVSGDFKVWGSKNFVAPHPSDPTKEIVFTSLEGPESGTYFRGTARIVGGYAKIEVPESFRLVTDEAGITAVVSPVGELAMLAVVHQSLSEIEVQGSADVEFNYIVNGVRSGYAGQPSLGRNFDFVPRFNDAKWSEKMTAETIRRLKSNGTLNPDGSINSETARRLGWDLQPKWNTPAREVVR
jgi:hypothetical protein